MISVNPDIMRFIIDDPSYAEPVSSSSDLELDPQACLVASMRRDRRDYLEEGLVLHGYE